MDDEPENMNAHPSIPLALQANTRNLLNEKSQNIRMAETRSQMIYRALPTPDNSYPAFRS